jgi:alpha-tubulin suppressor-like RCC1 family protein
MGTLWSVGFAGNLLLCNGTSTPNLTTPTQAGVVDTWAKVSAYNTVFLLRQDGTLWSAGSSLPQLGLGASPGNQSTPVQVGSASDWVEISVGDQVAFAINSSGELWACGNVTFGEVGNGTTTQTLNTLTKIGTGTNWAKIYAGYRYSYAIKTDGTLWTFGSNANGELGRGNYTSPQNTWAQVGFATNWVDCALTSQAALVLNSSGQVYATGKQSDGVIGDGSTSGTRNTLTLVSLPENAAAIGCGETQGLAIGVSGKLYGWGYNSGGLLATG